MVSALFYAVKPNEVDEKADQVLTHSAFGPYRIDMTANKSKGRNGTPELLFPQANAVQASASGSVYPSPRVQRHPQQSSPNKNVV